MNEAEKIICEDILNLFYVCKTIIKIMIKASNYKTKSSRNSHKHVQKIQELSDLQPNLQKIVLVYIIRT